MSRHLRLRLPGNLNFSTAAFTARGGALLVDQMDLLRVSVTQTGAERPFGIEAR